MYHDGNHGYDTVKPEVQTVMDTASGGVTDVDTRAGIRPKSLQECS